MMHLTFYALRFTHYASDVASAWRGWLWGISIIVIIAAAVVIWWTLVRRQGERVKRTCRLEVINQGNVRSRYEVWAEEPSGALRFDFMLQGAALGTGEQRSKGAAAQGFGEVKGWAKDMGGIAAELLGTLGMILPRSIGRPLSQAASRLRKGKSSVQRAERVSGQVSKLKSRATLPSDEVRDENKRKDSTPVPATTPDARPEAVNAGRVQTPFVEPGESLALKLRLTPTEPYQTRRYAFTVTSRSLERPGAQPLVEEGEIKIEGLTAFERYSPFLIVLAVAMTLLFLVSLLFSSIP